MQIFSEQNQTLWCKAALLLIAVYAGLFLFSFWKTPLGLTPVLDGAENIRLAEKIFQGTLPKEPFYRSMLYPAYLSVYRLIGFAHEELNALAAFSGILFHLLNAILVSFLSFLLWKTSRAMPVALLLYGLYPPALHFAADPLDITMALTFMLLSLLSFFYGLIETKSSLWHLLAGLILGIGVLLRANILPLAGIWALCLLFKNTRREGVIALLGLALPLFLGGLINYGHSGQFRLMPWQGAFNLYAANNQRANGKYFQQRLMVTDRELGTNPARLESEIFYYNAVGASSSFNIDEFNQYWRRKTLTEITDDPAAWAGLMLKKTYYLFNNFEQYNNKTFSFHKQLSPVLRYNPLCFGLILIFALLSVFNTKTERRHVFIFQAIVFLSGGVLAFYASARFRILLVPLFAALAPGFVNVPLSSWLNRRNFLLVSIVAFLSFSNFANAIDNSTWNTDRLLMAHACARLGMYEEQLDWAAKVLRRQPTNIQAIRLKLVAFSNLALAGKLTDFAAWKLVSEEMKLLFEKNLFYSDTMFLQGCYVFSHDKKEEEAVRIWEKGLQELPQKDIFLAALIFSNSIEVTSDMIKMSENSPLLWYVLAKSGKIDADDEKKFEDNAVLVKFLFNSGG